MSHTIDTLKPYSTLNDLIARYCVPFEFAKNLLYIANRLPPSHTLTYDSFDEVVSNYRKLKMSEVGHDLPSLQLNRFASTDVLNVTAFEQSTFLTEAIRFRELGDREPENIKPILLFYSMTLSSSFLCNSIFVFVNRKDGHGLRINYKESAEDCEVVISRCGKFARIVDTYGLFNCHSEFNPLVIHNKGMVQLSENQYSYYRKPEPRLSLAALVEMRKDFESSPVKTDLLDYLILYIASNLARYRPHQWKEATNGATSSVIIPIRGAMERVGLFTKRMIFSVAGIVATDRPWEILNCKDSRVQEAKTYTGRLGIGVD